VLHGADADAPLARHYADGLAALGQVM